jgi:protein SCO1/2
MRHFRSALCAAFAALVCSCANNPVEAVVVGGRLPSIPLEVADGSAFTRARETPLVISFVYSRCADICPLTLASLKRVYETLKDDQVRAQFLLITVDPERDRGAQFEAFLDSYEPSFVGLTGRPDVVHKVLHRLAVHSEKKYTASADGYSMKHSADIIVVDKRATVRHIFPFGTSPETITEAVEAIR